MCAVDLRAEAKRRKELEKEEHKMKELEEFKAQTRANANFKAKIAETEGRLMCTQCQTAMFPDAYGDYEFERSGFIGVDFINAFFCGRQRVALYAVLLCLKKYLKSLVHGAKRVYEIDRW